MEKHANTIEYEVYGDYALFSDPVVLEAKKQVIQFQLTRHCEVLRKAYFGNPRSFG